MGGELGSVMVEHGELHHFAFHNNDDAILIDSNTSWVLEDTSTETSDKVSFNSENLHIMAWWPLSGNNVLCHGADSNSVWKVKIAVLSGETFDPLATLSHLVVFSKCRQVWWLTNRADKFMVFAVVDNSVVVGVANDIGSIFKICLSTGLGECIFSSAIVTKDVNERGSCAAAIEVRYKSSLPVTVISSIPSGNGHRVWGSRPALVVAVRIIRVAIIWETSAS